MLHAEQRSQRSQLQYRQAQEEAKQVGPAIKERNMRHGWWQAASQNTIKRETTSSSCPGKNPVAGSRKCPWQFFSGLVSEVFFYEPLAKGVGIVLLLLWYRVLSQRRRAIFGKLA